MTAPSDQAARDRVVGTVGADTVVVAGAGSGKTTTLVRRVAAELRAGLSPANLAVITFTEKAARELSHRLRAEVPDVALDDAYVGTIHGFCARLLRRHPIEAGLPPVFDAVDEVTAAADSHRHARRLVRDLLDTALTDAELAGCVELLVQWRKVDALVPLVVALDRNWDRFSACTDLRAPDDAELHRTLLSTPTYLELGRIATHPWVADPDNADRLAALLRAGWAALGPLAHTRTIHQWLAAIDAFPEGGWNVGIGAAWARWTPWAVVAARDTGRQVAGELRTAVHDAVLRRVLRTLVPAVVAGAADRRRRGELNFDDLLTVSARLVRERPDVRAEIRARYRQIFVDEFQDTDPTQYELVHLLCTSQPDDRAGAARSTLFAVGDPKQAIYAFRGAEPALFQALAATAGDDGRLFELTANFRTRADVAGWINDLMAGRFQGAGREHQAPYQALQPVRAAAAADPGPAVRLLGWRSPGESVVSPRAADAAAAEAADIAATIREATAPVSAWTVGDDGRAATWRDVAVLVRGRGVLGSLEDEFRRAGIPYRVEGGTLVYESREVYELLRVLRAVARPDDPMRVVTALRTSVLGVSDRELVQFHELFGAWRVPSVERLDTAGPLPPGPLAVLAALDRLTEWHRTMPSTTPSALLTDIYDTTFGVTAARIEGRHLEADTWRRVRFVVDEARRWSDATGGTVGEYLEWIDQRIDAGDRAEIASDERDDSVRILTIHAAKGLEFPIVVVAGLGRKRPPPDALVARVVDGRPEVRLGKVATAHAADDDSKSRDAAEEARLLYVATTRACDHLVVSLHTSSRSSPSAVQNLATFVPPTGADLASPARPVPAGVADDDLGELVAAGDGTTTLPVLDRPPTDARRIWTPSSLATALPGGGADDGRSDDLADDAPGLRKDPANGQLQERSRGRYGTSIGIAVHAVLQDVPLDDPRHGLGARVERCCADIDVTDGRDIATVRRLAESIIESSLFQRFRSARRGRREIYVGTTLGEGDAQRVLWGYVDAAFEADDGSLFVIDFKTDSHHGSEGALAERYRLQMSGYAIALARSTGRPIGGAALLVGRRDGRPAEEVPVTLLGEGELAALLADPTTRPLSDATTLARPEGE